MVVGERREIIADALEDKQAGKWSCNKKQNFLNGKVKEIES
jgi:hypothetical protein